MRTACDIALREHGMHMDMACTRHAHCTYTAHTLHMHRMHRMHTQAGLGGSSLRIGFRRQLSAFAAADQRAKSAVLAVAHLTTLAS